MNTIETKRISPRVKFTFSDRPTATSWVVARPAGSKSSTVAPTSHPPRLLSPRPCPFQTTTRRRLYRRAARFGLFLRLWRSRFLRDFRPRFFFLFVLCVVVVLGVWNWHATICRQYYSRLLLLLLLIAHGLVLRARVLKKRVGSAQFLWFLVRTFFPFKEARFCDLIICTVEAAISRKRRV